MDAPVGQKFCTSCKTVKEVSEFTFKYLAKRVLHNYCRVCHAKWNRGHYERNKATYIANAQRNSARYRAENVRRIADYLFEHPCVDCGERDIIVLEFDHRDRRMKRLNVGEMIQDYCWAEIAREIAKCDVRCANDHRRRTARDLGWPRALLAVTSEQGRQDLNPQPPDLESGALPN